MRTQRRADVYSSARIGAATAFTLVVVVLLVLDVGVPDYDIGPGILLPVLGRDLCAPGPRGLGLLAGREVTDLLGRLTQVHGRPPGTTHRARPSPHGRHAPLDRRCVHLDRRTRGLDQLRRRLRLRPRRPPDHRPRPPVRAARRPGLGQRQLGPLGRLGRPLPDAPPQQPDGQHRAPRQRRPHARQRQGRRARGRHRGLDRARCPAAARRPRRARRPPGSGSAPAPRRDHPRAPGDPDRPHHVIDHHYIAGRLKPYCWRPWADDPWASRRPATSPLSRQRRPLPRRP